MRVNGKNVGYDDEQVMGRPVGKTFVAAFVLDSDVYRRNPPPRWQRRMRGWSLWTYRCPVKYLSTSQPTAIVFACLERALEGRRDADYSPTLGGLPHSPHFNIPLLALGVFQKSRPPSVNPTYQRDHVFL